MLNAEEKICMYQSNKYHYKTHQNWLNFNRKWSQRTHLAILLEGCLIEKSEFGPCRCIFHEMKISTDLLPKAPNHL